MSICPIEINLSGALEGLQNKLDAYGLVEKAEACPACYRARKLCAVSCYGGEVAH